MARGRRPGADRRHFRQRQRRRPGSAGEWGPGRPGGRAPRSVCSPRGGSSRPSPAAAGPGRAAARRRWGPAGGGGGSRGSPRVPSPGPAGRGLARFSSFPLRCVLRPGPSCRPRRGPRRRGPASSARPGVPRRPRTGAVGGTAPADAPPRARPRTRPAPAFPPRSWPRPLPVHAPSLPLESSRVCLSLQMTRFL